MTRALDAAAVLLTAALFLVASVGGIDVEFGPLRLRVHDWMRPAVALAVVLAGRAALGATARVASYVATRGMLALLFASAGVYAHYQVRVAGGLDSYGYVSTAASIASGRLSEPQPLADVLPFDNPLSAATPLGHVAGADGRSSVPRFPVGLPLVMALFMVFGSAGPFFVPFVMACVTLVLAYQIGRESSCRLTGLFAATLVAMDPLFVVYATQPMSDVPATCWLVAAVWLALRTGGTDRPFLLGLAAGGCAGMAMLTRPALLPAVALLVLVAARRKAPRLAFAFGATVLAFVAIQAALNVRLYGSPTASGYGPASHMFELSFARFSANVSNFGKWLTYSHTPLFWLLWPGALLVLRQHRLVWEVSAVAAAAAAPYLFYIVFDDWESSRFLLPSLTLVLILAARAIGHLTRRSPLAHAMVVFPIALACAAASHQFLQKEGLDRYRPAEAKYALVGDWFARHTPERTVVLAALHSGTIRMYGGRQTIRWDRIPDTALAATLRRLSASGYEPYLALDLPTEPPLFEERFRGQPVNVEQVARVRVVNIYRFVSAH